MLSRQQRFRRLRHKRVRDEQRARVPLSLFEQSGELVGQNVRLHKSFSDQGVDTPRDEGVEGARMRRSVSDNFTSSRRTLFSSAQPAAAVVTAMRAGPALGDGATTSTPVATVCVEQKRCRAVNFHERVAVVLIPAAKDMQQEDKHTLWWTRSELQNFQRELVRALPPNTNLRQNILSLGELAAFAGCDFSATPFAVCEPLQQQLCKSAVGVPAKAVRCTASSSSSAEATAVVAVSITAALAVLDLNGRGASCLRAAARPVAV
jgi:hypothetical protein